MKTLISVVGLAVLGTVMGLAGMEGVESAFGALLFAVLVGLFFVLVVAAGIDTKKREGK